MKYVTKYVMNYIEPLSIASRHTLLLQLPGVLSGKRIRLVKTAFDPEWENLETV